MGQKQPKGKRDEPAESRDAPRETPVLPETAPVVGTEPESEPKPGPAVRDLEPKREMQRHSANASASAPNGPPPSLQDELMPYFIHIDYVDADLNRRIVCEHWRVTRKALMEQCAICRGYLTGPCIDCMTMEFNQAVAGEAATYQNPRAASFFLDLSKARLIADSIEKLKSMWEDSSLRFCQLPRDVFNLIIEKLYPIKVECRNNCPVVLGSW